MANPLYTILGSDTGSAALLTKTNGNMTDIYGRIPTGTTAPYLVAGTYQLTDGATIAIDWNNGQTQYVTLGATGRTVTFANPIAGQVYRIIVIQDGTGSRTITTWPTIKWAGGSAPALTTTGGKADIVTLLYANGSYYGDINKNF
jgi:hypothetical protein